MTRTTSFDGLQMPTAQEFAAIAAKHLTQNKDVQQGFMPILSEKLSSKKLLYHEIAAGLIAAADEFLQLKPTARRSLLIDIGKQLLNHTLNSGDRSLRIEKELELLLNKTTAEHPAEVCPLKATA